MNRLFRYQNGEIKVMWNEIPMKNDYKESYYNKIITQETRPLSYTYMLGVELQIHTGGRICYGMLCSKVQPFDKRNIVKISIAFTQKNTVKYKSSLDELNSISAEDFKQKYLEGVDFK